MAPTSSKQAEPRGYSPVSSTYTDRNGGDFVLLDEEQRDAEWDGDQTKYIPPTISQSLAASAKLALDGIMNEPLTKENLMRNTAPLAQDIGMVTKQGLGVAAGWAGQTLIKIGSAAAAYGQAITPNSSASVNPTPGASDLYDKTGRNLSDSEQNAITKAILNGQLHTRDKHSKAVKAFLANWRKEQAVMEWTTKRGAGTFDDNGEMEEIDLGEPYVDDPDVVEDLQPGGESSHVLLTPMTTG
ncbi:MAG: hypothetical protein Q9208_007674 [Pyrenodesmia sp. 3 TL-2023]